MAIDAIKEKETLQELASKYKVSAVTINKWKAEFLSNSALANTLEARVCTEVLDEAIAKYGKPEILNSDQGSQFTCPRWVNKLKAEGIQISMDGKGRAKNRSASRRVTLGLSKNIWIERFWNTIKREHIYLNPADDGLELYRGIKVYIDYYNNKRAHQGIDRIRPSEAYGRAAA